MMDGLLGKCRTALLLRADAPYLRRRLGQKPGLIEASFEVPPRAHRHESHRVKRPAQLFGGGLASAAGALMEAGAAGVVCAALAGGRRKTEKTGTAPEDFGKI